MFKFPLLLAFLAIYAAPAPAQSLSSTRETISNTTVHYYEPAHGNQIEFYAAGGRLFLWYPGNRRVVQGEWKVEKTKSCDVGADGFYACKTLNSPSVCYKYPSGSYNPVSNQSGGSFECETLQDHRRTQKEILLGDPFQLSRKKRVPFRLPRDWTATKTLLTKFKDQK